MEYSIVILANCNSYRLQNSVTSALRNSDEVIVVYEGDKSEFIQLYPGIIDIVTFVECNERSFAARRNIGVVASSKEWILHLDSDEVLTQNLENELKKLKDDSSVGIYRVSFITWVWSRPVRYSFGDNFSSRLHRRSITWTGAVHECLSDTELRTLTLKNQIDHYTLDSLQQWIEKTLTYVRTEGQGLYGARHRVNNPVVRPFYRFVRIYLYNRGFLDGIPGLIVATLSFIYEILVSISRWESDQTTGIGKGAK